MLLRMAADECQPQAGLYLKGERELGKILMGKHSRMSQLREGAPGSILSIDGGETGSLGPAFADGVTVYIRCVWSPLCSSPLP